MKRSKIGFRRRNILRSSLREYQTDAARWMLGRPQGALLADPGTGKTLITLTHLRRLKLLEGHVKVLLVAPIRVMHNVWPAEIEKWGFDFTTEILHGPKKVEKLHSKADIHLINPEGLKWLGAQEPPDYNVFLLDESSLFRNPTSVRIKVLKRILPAFKYRYILTGTPAPRSMQDLWSQMYILDFGKRLGKNVTAFRNAYFYHEKRGEAHFWHLIPGMEQTIWDRIADLCYRIDAETHLDLPELIINDIMVTLPPPAQKIYKSMEIKLFAEIDGNKRFARTSGSLYGMCRQIAGGAVYKEDSKEYDVIHGAKLQALDELRNELGGKPLLVVFQFRHELKRLQERFGKQAAIAGGTKEARISALLSRWNRGELPLLFVQSQSISHGVNLQSGGNDIVWYTLTPDLDIYEQLNRRLYRSGVRGAVRIHRLIARGTVDHAVIGSLTCKRGSQQGLFDALEAYRKNCTTPQNDVICLNLCHD